MAEIKVYGAPWCPDCRRAKKFLAEHRVPYEWIDVDTDPAALAYVQDLQDGGRTIPTIVVVDGSLLIEPTNEELARKLGMNLTAERRFYDLVIVGGGPTGLAAAIYAAREGIDAIVVERSALGGQAGVTERIDNYPGFPDGIGGAELANRFVAQARRYEVELLEAVGARDLRYEPADRTVAVELDNGQQLVANAALIATGSSYRRLDVPGEDDLIGAGVHFCATCDGPFYRGSDEILVVGGGNSGLEEGLFLARFADRIRIVEFAPELKASRLLQDKVAADPRFTVHTNTEIVELVGDKSRLREVVARDRVTGAEYRWQPAATFVFIGLDPNTAFLRLSATAGEDRAAAGEVELDRWGFVITDGEFATGRPGVFAAGDVRAGSTKQLGAAVGDGIAALISIRAHLQQRHELMSVSVNA